MQKDETPRYPQLPAFEEGAGGPVRIVMVATPGNDKDNIGHFNAAERRIEIAEVLSPDQRWWTVYHELTHAALCDSGIHNLLTAEMQEAICDAVGTARLRERFG